MKISLCTDWFRPKVGGVESHVLGPAETLVEKGHLISIITHAYREHTSDETIGRVKVYRMGGFVEPYTSTLCSPSIQGIAKILKLEDPDIVYGHHIFTPIPLASVYFAKKLRKATVLMNHSTSRPSVCFAYPVIAPSFNISTSMLTS